MTSPDTFQTYIEYDVVVVIDLGQFISIDTYLDLQESQINNNCCYICFVMICVRPDNTLFFGYFLHSNFKDNHVMAYRFQKFESIFQ